MFSRWNNPLEDLKIFLAVFSNLKRFALFCFILCMCVCMCVLCTYVCVSVSGYCVCMCVFRYMLLFLCMIACAHMCMNLEARQKPQMLFFMLSNLLETEYLIGCYLSSLFFSSPGIKSMSYVNKLPKNVGSEDQTQVLMVKR